MTFHESSSSYMDSVTTTTSSTENPMTGYETETETATATNTNVITTVKNESKENSRLLSKESIPTSTSTVTDNNNNNNNSMRMEEVEIDSPENDSKNDNDTHNNNNNPKEKAEEYKNQGNQCLKQFQFTTAIDYYTLAIALYPTAIYYANRAAVHLLTENYGLAIKDADSAIQLDPLYIKSYYRRATANLALGHYKIALKDFKYVIKLYPKDLIAREKLKICEKSFRENAFAQAIETEQNIPISQTIDLNNIYVDTKVYDGPTFDTSLINDQIKGKEFIIALMSHFKRTKLLHRKYVLEILLHVKNIFQSLPSLLRLEIPSSRISSEPETLESNKKLPCFTVCGDTHGQFYDVCNIFDMNGLPSDDNVYLFNGDFVDRGSFSFEVVMLFFAIKVVFPNSIHLLRGNHESKNMNKFYGFEGEIKHKYDDTVMGLFTEVFNWLPLAGCLEEKVLVVHGGLFEQRTVTLDDIAKIKRNREIPESGLMTDILWSDPQPFNGRGPSKRGIGLSFGPDITKQFLEDNKLELLIRSHEVKPEGYVVEHDGKCVTVFSAPNYCDQMGNKGAFIRFTDKTTVKPEFVQFTAVDHPPIRPMAYAGNGGMLGL